MVKEVLKEKQRITDMHAQELIDELLQEEKTEASKEKQKNKKQRNKNNKQIIISMKE